MLGLLILFLGIIGLVLDLGSSLFSLIAFIVFIIGLLCIFARTRDSYNKLFPQAMIYYLISFSIILFVLFFYLFSSQYTLGLAFSFITFVLIFGFYCLATIFLTLAWFIGECNISLWMLLIINLAMLGIMLCLSYLFLNSVRIEL